jgi:hypothetical protein
LGQLREEPSIGLLLRELELGRVKKSGLFLDNLKIFLSGFSEADQVHLTRVLKFAGATRYGSASIGNSHGRILYTLFLLNIGSKISENRKTVKKML